MSRRRGGIVVMNERDFDLMNERGNKMKASKALKPPWYVTDSSLFWNILTRTQEGHWFGR
jgi:hypothetical protein